MPNRNDPLFAAVIVALAHVWDGRLPGFRADLKLQIDRQALLTPVGQITLRQALERLSDALDS